MIFAYASVPTGALNFAIRQEHLRPAACEHVCDDGFTDATTDRPRLERLMTKLRESGRVIILAVGRLAHHPIDLVVIARAWVQA